MKKILTFGVFDYFHIGHLRLFEQCKQHGDYLIVAIQNGEFVKKYKPEAELFYSTDDRVEIISGLKIVDETYVYDRVCVETLEKIDFNILALGEDHIGGRFDEIVSWCQIHNKEVVRLKRTKGVSSTEIKEKIRKQVE